MFFKNINTIEELKKEYKRLVLKNHPDMGGSLEKMKMINLEYEKMFEILKRKSKNPNQYDINDGFRQVIDKIIHLNINIEICGSWIWVSGDTKAVKNELKKAGFWWASKKCMWYWRPAEQARKRRKTLSIEGIREKYGSEIIKNANKVVALV